MAKTHKTIFGTTEKSNFILNMTNDQFNKLASVMFTIGFSLIFVLSAVAEPLQHTTGRSYPQSLSVSPVFLR